MIIPLSKRKTPSTELLWPEESAKRKTFSTAATIAFGKAQQMDFLKTEPLIAKMKSYMCLGSSTKNKCNA